MTDRSNPGGGGLTGATGDLTPESPEQAFEPGERREVAGPDRAEVTERQAGASARPTEPGETSGSGTSIGADERSDSEERF